MFVTHTHLKLWTAFAKFLDERLPYNPMKWVTQLFKKFGIGALPLEMTIEPADTEMMAWDLEHELLVVAERPQKSSACLSRMWRDAIDCLMKAEHERTLHFAKESQESVSNARIAWYYRSPAECKMLWFGFQSLDFLN